VEEDDGWAAEPSTNTRNAAFVPRFQELCEAFGLKPSYLVNYPMAVSGEFVEFGRDVLSRRAGEIGMHLHAWNTPPIVPITNNDAGHHTYLIDYSLPVMREKISRMTALLGDTFGEPILSHRAGRWALDDRYARLLVEHEYRVDCSVTPHISWQHHRGAPGGPGGTDYTDYPEAPYFMDTRDPARPGRSKLLELPVTIFPQGGRRGRVSRLVPRRVLASRLGNLLNPSALWLRPNGRNREAMIDIAGRVLDEGRPYAQFMIHSSELMPGGSPTFRGADDIQKLYDDLGALFDSAKDRFVGATLAEFAAAATLTGDGT
jgi:hypothetical protein